MIERERKDSPLDDEGVEIDKETYQRCVAAFALVERHLGINIKLHGTTDNPESELDDADILVLNHFARFETVVPGYLVYKATGRYCRTLASGELFRGSPAFKRFLTSIGGVPNDMEGVLAFLAAEILRGRKVVIFPEGGMIKDRKVTDDKGEIAIVSPSSGKKRKHHTGAAAVALVLEIFKERIRSISGSGESERLGRWAQALGIEEVETLVARASRPTRITPTNITFHPIRADENILTKGANLLFRGLAANVQEELLVEGNILLKHTDMDIRLASTTGPDIRWSWWERQLLAWSFSQIQSLDHLFDLNVSPNKLIDRLASTLVHHNIRRLRDQCMIEMYRHTTINLAHLASRMIKRLMGDTGGTIQRRDLGIRLYAALKTLQTTQGLFLHRGLQEPDCYAGLLQGSCPDLEQLLETASSTGLLEHDDAEIREAEIRGNTAEDDAPQGRKPTSSDVIRVYVNELAPLQEACDIVDRLCDAEEPATPRNLADWRIDDERRRFVQAKNHFTKPRYEDVNSRETATADAAPYLLEPEHPGRLGVLLVHGFLASPAELKDLGHRLVEHGHVVMGTRLCGHGTSPHDLGAAQLDGLARLGSFRLRGPAPSGGAHRDCWLFHRWCPGAAFRRRPAGRTCRRRCSCHARPPQKQSPASGPSIAWCEPAEQHGGHAGRHCLFCSLRDLPARDQLSKHSRCEPARAAAGHSRILPKAHRCPMPCIGHPGH